MVSATLVEKGDQYKFKSHKLNSPGLYSDDALNALSGSW